MSFVAFVIFHVRTGEDNRRVGAQLSLEFSAPGGFGNVPSRAVGQGLDRSRRLLAAGRNQTASVGDEEIGNAVSAVPAIHYTRSRIIAHAAGAH